jgi:urease accessory protein
LSSPTRRAADAVACAATPVHPVAPAVAAAGAAANGWEASLEIAFVELGGATSLVRNGQRGPLVVQRAFSPEGREVSHVYLLHPPGGLVGGDRLNVGIKVAGRAHALVTTPAATKLYRSTGATARQEQRLTVAAGGALEWLPQETILFDGALADLRTRVELADGARFIGMDLLCFGLPARGMGFQQGRCRQRLELWSRGQSLRPILIERGRFDGDAPVHAARWGFGGAPVLGTLLAAPAPVDGASLPALRALADALPADDLAAVTVLGGGAALACRYLGPSVERGGRFLREAWRLLRPALLGRPAVPPRIWAT